MPARNFRELLEAMPADRQQRIEKRLQKSLAAMPLDQLRKAQEMTQFQVAVNQGDWQARRWPETGTSTRMPSSPFRFRANDRHSSKNR